LPDQIRVAVVERQPVAFARQGGQLGLVDADGVLLTMPAAMMAQRHYSFPVVTGIDPGDSPEARKARMAVYRRLLDELDSGGQKLSAQISEIDLTDAEDARVTMQDDTTLLHFGQERFLERYKRYKAQISQLRQQYPKLVAVDLRYEQEAVMEMATGAEQAVPEAGDATGASQPAVAEQAAEAAPAANRSPEKHAAGTKARIDSASSSAKVKAAASTSKTAQAAPSPRRGAVTVKTATPKTAAAKEKIVKNNAAKMRAAREKKKKRAVAERAALKAKRQRIAPNLRPAAVMVEGQ
jgi:cell division protein FtsQ